MDTIKHKTHEFFFRHPVLTYKKGEMIIRADDAPHGVCFIEKGVVRQYTINGSGETLMIQLYRPGAFFPMTWVMNQTPNRYFFEAATQVVVRRVPREELLDQIDKHPEILKDFVGRLLSGVIGLWSRIEHLVLDSAYIKTIQLLLYYAEKFGEKDNRGVVLSLSPTHREIAAWIGTTRETASLQIVALKNKKLLVSRGRQLVIPSLSALEKELSSARPSRL